MLKIVSASIKQLYLMFLSKQNYDIQRILLLKPRYSILRASVNLPLYNSFISFTIASPNDFALRYLTSIEPLYRYFFHLHGSQTNK